MGNGPSTEDVRAFYKSQIGRKVRDFVNGNQRVESAWQTIESWSPQGPQNIIEIGCGVGYISWRMSLRWPMAKVRGTDTSPESVAIATQLFSGGNLSFGSIPPPSEIPRRHFDLMLLMDVYEHVPQSERDSLHSALREGLADGGRLILTFPTPRHLAHLRNVSATEIQPVDEDITVKEILRMADDTDTEILHYSEVSVWHRGDYAHAVLARISKGLPPLTAPSDRQRQSIVSRIVHRSRRAMHDTFRSEKEPVSGLTLSQRDHLVRSKLGNVNS